ncbi:MAG: helix-turn-helix transcriptional regulator [Ruminiclostridium sp.]|nr:helix-turn-helix transcriptional regulator [Ruminiclostridium sp.]
MPDLKPANFIKWEHVICIDGYTVETSFDAYLLSFSGIRFGEYIHSHSRYEVHIPGETGLKIMLGSKMLELPYGKIMIIAPNTYHTCLPENAGRRGFSYSFKENGITGFAAPLNFKDDFVIFQDSCETLNTIYKIEKIYGFADNGCQEQVAHLFSSLLIDFARALAVKSNIDAYQESQKPYPESANSMNAATVNATTADAIAANTITIMDQYFTIKYNNQFQKKSLAKMLSVSERQLERIIFCTYGMTFKEKVQKTRLDMANYLIRHFEYSVAETVEIIGYSSEQSFYRAYKKYFGISPHQFPAK